MSVVGDAMRLATGTLTVLPVRPPRALGPRVAGPAMALAPVVVLPVAGLAAGVLWALDAADTPPLVAAALAIAVLAIGSGVLHLDGLADTADGLAVQGDRARRLEVMRRGDVGPAGVIALLLVVLVQVTALAALAARDGAAAAAALCLAVVASRSTLAVACARGIRPARADGLGSVVAGSVPAYVGAAVVTAVAVTAGLVDQWQGVVGVVAAVAAAGVVVLVARRCLGGVTGDVLGACVELALAGYLVSQAVGAG